MKTIVMIVLTLVLFACGPDRVLLMETKFDAPLRQKMTALADREDPENLLVLGKCAGKIDGVMRQALVDAGADVRTMQGEIFTASVSSGDIYSVAALEFVSQLQLSQTSKPVTK
ncbi:MAG: hypothetical protein HW407_1965 [Bacteroidetes bacterium]|nr:hypothetical protein [Bacteroidota bacterium]